MAGKPRYDEADKARVYVALAANDGNIKRTARETGVPETTVRRFKQEFEKEGPPPQEIVDVAVGDFAESIERVEWKALAALERKIDKDDVNARDLITAFGVLNDKRTRALGLATERTEHVHRLPSAEEVAGLLQGLSHAALEATRQRQSDIVSAELREQPLGLPAPRT